MTIEDWLNRLTIYDGRLECSMDAKEYKERTKRFALAVIEMIQGLPKNAAGDVLGRQLLRSSSSVGANYRAACRARSHADMLAKLKIVEEEADELVAMTVASIKTLRNRQQSSIVNHKS